MGKPLVAIVGTTGVGKSSLAVKIAKAIQGHIINCDSMQVYRGLDIITNKPDAEERAIAPHHLFDFIDPSQEYSILEFFKDSIETIKDVHQKKQSAGCSGWDKLLFTISLI